MYGGIWSAVRSLGRRFAFLLLRLIPWSGPRNAIINLPPALKRLGELLYLLICKGGILLLLLYPIVLFWDLVEKRLRKTPAHVPLNKMVPSIDESPDLRAACFFDSPLNFSWDISTDDPTFIIPVLNSYRTSGLIVQQVSGVVGAYRRIGVFEMDSFMLGKFEAGSGSLVRQSFCLI